MIDRAGGRIGTTLRVVAALAGSGLLALSTLDCSPLDDTERSPGPRRPRDAVPEVALTVEGGWLTREGRVIWGMAQHNGFWGGLRDGDGFWTKYRVRANITRRMPGQIGPNATEDLDQLTDSMLNFGYPGFEHHFGLWYDRRRDDHGSGRRKPGPAKPPFLEQPWARTGETAAWDGQPRYDLEKWNDWYFARLREFSRLGEEKGTALLFNFYSQRPLLERQAQYVDFAWRPANNLQATGMPDTIPAANVFYDVSDPERRRLHRLYIRKCLDELAPYGSVVFSLGHEFTGPFEFASFWLETIDAWQRETGRDLLVSLGATKDVTEAVMADTELSPIVDILDLRYWWYEPDGSLFAPRGGEEAPGRYAGGHRSGKTTAEQLHRQLTEARRAYPDLALIHSVVGDVRHSWTMLMGSASLFVVPFEYSLPDGAPPSSAPETYVAPGAWPRIRGAYTFVRRELASSLGEMTPCPPETWNSSPAWCLSDDEERFLLFARDGAAITLTGVRPGEAYLARRVDPDDGRTTSPERVVSDGSGVIRVSAAGPGDWAVLLERPRGNAGEESR